jgi:uncharacterized membrane protein
MVLALLAAGLLGLAVTCDLIHLVPPRDPGWSHMAYGLMAGGIIIGLIVTAFGWIDFHALQSGSRSRQTALIQGAGTTAAIVLFAASFALRGDNPGAPTWLAQGVSGIALLVALASAWGSAGREGTRGDEMAGMDAAVHP